MGQWLARIVADVCRANQWLDPEWKPKRRKRVVKWSPEWVTWTGANTWGSGNACTWTITV